MEKRASAEAMVGGSPCQVPVPEGPSGTLLGLPLAGRRPDGKTVL